MLYNNKENLLNYFSDFILEKIPNKELSVIEVVDCTNFVVVKGKTTSKDVLNLIEIRDEFLNKKNLEINLTHTIDLIEYNVDLTELNSLNCIFYNSPNLKMTNCELKEKENKIPKMISHSSFPYGYSLKSGKDLYYYAKHIAYNLQMKHIWDTIEIKISRINNEEEFEIYTNCEIEQDVELKSAILDSFDFNFEKFGLLYEKSNWVTKSLESDVEFDFISKINDKLILF